MSASLMWETPTTVSLPSDPTFTTVRTTKNTTGDIASNLDTTVSLVCDGHFACAGTAWANRLQSNSKWQVSDWDAKKRRKKKYGLLPKIRKLNVWDYQYKDDPSDTPMIGVMAQQLLPVFPELVHVPAIPTEYKAVNTDGITAVTLGGLIELDKSTTDGFEVVDTRMTRIEQENDNLRRDMRVQADRLREQDDRIRAQNDRARAQSDQLCSLEDVMRKQAEQIRKLEKVVLELSSSTH